MGKYFDNKKIVGLHKKFDEKLHKKYDIPARNKIKEVLGDFINCNPNKFAQDFIINSDECKYKYLEIQVCSTWVNEKYPHKNVFVYARKSLYGPDTLFLTINKFNTRGYVFDANSFSDAKPRRLKKYSREFVYDIPWNKVMYVCIDNLDKETLELF